MRITNKQQTKKEKKSNLSTPIEPYLLPTNDRERKKEEEEEEAAEARCYPTMNSKIEDRYIWSAILRVIWVVTDQTIHFASSMFSHHIAFNLLTAFNVRRKDISHIVIRAAIRYTNFCFLPPFLLLLRKLDLLNVWRR